MAQFQSRIHPEQILLCDLNPDDRTRVNNQFLDRNYTVLATGNIEVASTLVQERPFKMMIFVLPNLKLSMLSLLILARRSQPQMPIVLVFRQPGLNNVPSSLVDVVLDQPTDEALLDCLSKLWRQSTKLATVS